MYSLKDLCKPRDGVFDRSRRDTVLLISDLKENRIDPAKFFSENYLTNGMQSLFSEAFRRFSGKSDAGVITLTQAMGGGKTHCMIALALLAKHPEMRKQVLGDICAYDEEPIEVVAFNGRESDAPYGIWGEIADQLGKKDAFKDYYTPLQAPGQSAWTNLLKRKRLLILLDELPPYFENAKSKEIGNSDLSVVSGTALSNLLVAVNKEELSRVCVVISDLKATYEGGSQAINEAVKNFENEVKRSSIRLEPVGLNTDEVYQILKKRIFERLPDDDVILKIAQSYGDEIRRAEQMGLTHVSPEAFVLQARESYPFHPAIRDLYARFRENPGFQQTRGLIRLMRTIVSGIYSSGLADSAILIHPHMVDLNQADTLAEIDTINSTLKNAISHDIASNGTAAAEQEDERRGGTEAQDICKLLLMSSLANIQNPVLGLTRAEIVTNLCAPGRSVQQIPDILAILQNEVCWYLHQDNAGRVYFKNTENLVAKLRSLSESFSAEAALKDVKERLEEIFAPELKDCYQEIAVLPAIDDLAISQDKVTLILYKPSTSSVHPDIQGFYDYLDYKNRVLFLSGQRETMNRLTLIGKEYKAIKSILAEMESEGVRSDDYQMITAQELRENIVHRLLSAARETFTVLIYPHNEELRPTTVMMNFEGNRCRGEELIRSTLKDKHKFTDDIGEDNLRAKCEQRLFSQPVMQWSEIKRRAAMNTRWQWHHPKALDDLKDLLVGRDQWRIEGSYINKGPFAKEKTSVQITVWNRDDDTGEATLKVYPQHGDRVYYDIGSPATPSSMRVEDLNAFTTSEMAVSFLCVDSTGEHETGEPVVWKNTVTLKKRVYGDAETRQIELRAVPAGATIRYTTDGSNPTRGGIYTNDFSVDRSRTTVLAVAEKAGVVSEPLRIDLDWEKTGSGVDPTKPARWSHSHAIKTTKEAYDLIALMKKFEVTSFDSQISIIGDSTRWVELTVGDGIGLTGAQIEAIIDSLREIYREGQIGVGFQSMAFVTGKDLLDFVSANKTNLNTDEVTQ
jgi:predicted transcriptional regulator